MTFSQTQVRQRLRMDLAKRAIALAMQNRWSEAVEANLSILSDFPDYLEAYNRLGKALAEEGRTGQAKEAFRHALEISPHNTIARKNLDRLMRIEDEEPGVGVKGGPAGHTFIEESGKAGVTSLMNTAPASGLLKEAPGHSVELVAEGGTLRVVGRNNAYLGQVEPRLASRLTRLLKGGNRYEAAVTSVGDQELSIIIREVYQHPSQTGSVSFPLRGGASYGVYLPRTILGYDLGEDEAVESEPAVVKDWSNDDTDPGDDAAFSPLVHRIISTDAGSAETEAED